MHFSAEEFAQDSFFIHWVRSPDDEADWFWKSFIREHPEMLEKIEIARRLILEIDYPVYRLEEDELSRMRNSFLMKVTAERNEDRSLENKPDLVSSPWWRAAAAVLIAVSAGLIYYTLSSDGIAVQANREATPRPALEQRVSPVGQKSVVLLNDGTRVWLNAASTISYAKDFGVKGSRDVYLDGEAFFDVVHDAKRPFIVHTSSIQIKVLGTTFNVKSYSEEKTIETTLVQGKVRIEQRDVDGNAVDLQPNQQAVFDKTSRVINVREVEASLSGSWKEDRLVFDEESIDDVLLQLERWYNVKIHVADRGNLDCKLTASIEKESLEEVLKLIREIHDVTYVVSGRDVFIEGTFCR